MSTGDRRGTVLAGGDRDEDHRPGRAASLALSLSMFLILCEGGALNLAVPRIAGDLAASTAGLEWIVNAYVLPLASGMILAGGLGDRIGRDRLLKSSLAGFALSTGVCALSPDLTVLITARAAQGVCAAGVLPMILALAVSSYPDPATQARVVNTIAVAGSLGLVTGPVLGAVVTEALGWRFVFVVVLPLALMAAAASRHLVDVPAPLGRRPAATGLALGVLGPVLLISGLVELSTRGPRSVVVLALLAAGLGAATAFVLLERRTSRPVIPGTLRREPAFRAAVVAGYAFQFAGFGLPFMLALHLQRNWDLDPIGTAMVLAPFSLVTIVGTTTVNPLLARRGQPFMLRTGMSMALLGTLVTLGVAGPGTWPILTIGTVLVGLGSSIYSPSLNHVATRSGGDHPGLASGVYFTARQMSMATAVAALGALVLSPHPVAGLRTGVVISAILLTASRVLMARAGQTSDDER
ncbi:MFS transporter [Nocardioides sp. 503]|uniref:MFS transporter n=1 Tax=Nocardioides sp. 503 TaxID=2508326 RepID=UPI001070207F|nr:MFS transporter [Nocardioides sp. 503]